MTQDLPAKLTEPRTVEDWREAQHQQRLQIAALDGQQAAMRGAELTAMLETANAKIDRFGWSGMDDNLKQSLINDWCDRLCQYTLKEVKAGIEAVFQSAKGRLRSINEHQVEDEIRKAHKKKLATLHSQKPPAPKKERISADRAADILKQAGFAVKRIEG